MVRRGAARAWARGGWRRPRYGREGGDEEGASESAGEGAAGSGALDLSGCKCRRPCTTSVSHAVLLCVRVRRFTQLKMMLNIVLLCLMVPYSERFK